MLTVAAFAQQPKQLLHAKPAERISGVNGTLVKSNLKMLPKAQNLEAKTSRRAPASANDLAGYYVWEWQQSEDFENEIPEIIRTGYN